MRMTMEAVPTTLGELEKLCADARTLGAFDVATVHAMSGKVSVSFDVPATVDGP